MRLFFSDRVFEAVEGDLDGDGGDGLLAAVGDLAVDVGGLGAGDAPGLAHLEIGDGEAGGVGVGRGEPGTARVGRFMRWLTEDEENADNDQDDDEGDDPGKWRARLALGRTIGAEEAGIGRGRAYSW